MEYADAIILLLNAIIDQAVLDLDDPANCAKARVWLAKTGIRWAYIVGWTNEDILEIKSKLDML